MTRRRRQAGGRCRRPLVLPDPGRDAATSRKSARRKGPSPGSESVGFPFRGVCLQFRRSLLPVGFSNVGLRSSTPLDSVLVAAKICFSLSDPRQLKKPTPRYALFEAVSSLPSEHRTCSVFNRTLSATAKSEQLGVCKRPGCDSIVCTQPCR